MVHYLLFEFQNAGNTGPGAGGKTFCLMLGNESLPRNQYKDRSKIRPGNRMADQTKLAPQTTHVKANAK